MKVSIVRTSSKEGQTVTFLTRIEVEIKQGVNTLKPFWEGTSTESQAAADGIARAAFDASDLAGNVQFILDNTTAPSQ